MTVEFRREPELLCKGGEHRTEHREVQCRHILTEQFWEEVDISLVVSRGSIQFLNQTSCSILEKDTTSNKDRTARTRRDQM